MVLKYPALLKNHVFEVFPLYFSVTFRAQSSWLFKLSSVLFLQHSQSSWPSTHEAAAITDECRPRADGSVVEGTDERNLRWIPDQCQSKGFEFIITKVSDMMYFLSSFIKMVIHCFPNGCTSYYSRKQVSYDNSSPCRLGHILWGKVKQNGGSDYSRHRRPVHKIRC